MIYWMFMVDASWQIEILNGVDIEQQTFLGDTANISLIVGSATGQAPLSLRPWMGYDPLTAMNHQDHPVGLWMFMVDMTASVSPTWLSQGGASANSPNVARPQRRGGRCWFGWNIVGEILGMSTEIHGGYIEHVGLGSWSIMIQQDSLRNR